MKYYSDRDNTACKIILRVTCLLLGVLCLLLGVLFVEGRSCFVFVHLGVTWASRWRNKSVIGLFYFKIELNRSDVPEIVWQKVLENFSEVVRSSVTDRHPTRTTTTPTVAATVAIPRWAAVHSEWGLRIQREKRDQTHHIQIVSGKTLASVFAACKCVTHS